MESLVGHLEVKQSAVTWKIDNFSQQCKQKGECIESTVFELGDFGHRIGTKWRLRLYPFGHTFGRHKASDGADIAAYLSFVPYDEIENTKLEYSWELSILDNTGSLVHTLREQSAVGEFNPVALTWGWTKFIKRRDLLRKKSTLLKDDALTISFSLKEKSWDNQKEGNLTSSLANQYESLYLSKEFSDVTIVIKDKEIKAHKCILSSKSKVFLAMLKHDMEEGNKSIINIVDVEYDVMKEFLLFVYCEKVKDIDSFARSLLPVSDKYDVVELKQMCEKSLWNDITVENACEMLCTADLYNCEQLKSDIITYIVTNIKEVINTTSFDEISNSNPTLINEIFRELVKQRISD